MTQKNQTLINLLSLVATTTLIFGGSWFLMERWGQIVNHQTNNQNSAQKFNIFKVFNTCDISNSLEGTYSYGGSTTWAPVRTIADSILQRNCPQFILRYTQPVNQSPGSGTGIRMLIDNQLTFSQSSRPLKPEENVKAQQKGFSLREIPVGIDGIAIAVNHSLNIPGLTIVQIKDIYTGKITNWQQVGGPNLGIKPISRDKQAGGTVEFFVENILNKENFGAQVIYIGTTTEALRKIDATPGGIYYGSAPEVVPQCGVKSLPVGRVSGKFIAPYQKPEVPRFNCPKERNRLNIEDFRNGNYPITRNLFVITKQNNQIDQQVGEAYANWLLTNEGQELIEKSGFVRIR
ncbi:MULTISPECIES: PstS family phosphate ABC transporter substrate-binding protein [Cylindrospermopsis]|uniref:PstS family phosphate ABC transporter substrate-binding protein n=1 Tax=Cylindrospermopsis TaxID=77021 RepID=UPI00070FC90E|nr:MULTISPECIES: PstS family phosphate ABC transporter substrate-binding protein [Cylindrospermopsis]KRH96970.1 phosphate ABC transporter substrate-binding protein [Cylindrospermopsis sp. CR12]UJL34896.1 PstS family phosphate ABC transporter substrate-binding protein [Cylindrospermopsis raciborskii Cr2010]